MNLRALLDNPAALIGVLRAIAIFAVGWGATWLTDQRIDDAVNLVTAIMVVISLAFTGASTKATNNQIAAARAEGAVTGEIEDTDAPTS